MLWRDQNLQCLVMLPSVQRKICIFCSLVFPHTNLSDRGLAYHPEQAFHSQGHTQGLSHTSKPKTFLTLAGSPFWMPEGTNQCSCTEAADPLSWLRIHQWCCSIRVPSRLWVMSKMTWAGTNGLWHTEERLMMSPTCPVANIYKETFLRVHGDRIGKSLVLLAYTHMHTHRRTLCTIVWRACGLVVKWVVNVSKKSKH